MWVNDANGIRTWRWELQGTSDSISCLDGVDSSTEERIQELEKQIAELQGTIEELMVKVKPCDLEGLL